MRACCPFFRSSRLDLIPGKKSSTKECVDLAISGGENCGYSRCGGNSYELFCLIDILFIEFSSRSLYHHRAFFKSV